MSDDARRALVQIRANLLLWEQTPPGPRNAARAVRQSIEACNSVLLGETPPQIPQWLERLTKYSDAVSEPEFTEILHAQAAAMKLIALAREVCDSYADDSRQRVAIHALREHMEVSQ